MRKIISILFFIISIQSFGQTKKYAERLNTDLSIDSFYVKLFTDSVFAYSNNNFVSFTLDYYSRNNLLLPAAFSNFHQCDDGIHRNFTPRTQAIDYTQVGNKPAPTIIYAKNYGVVADGVTDDWAAITAALNAANAAGGGDVILPLGKMLTSRVIKFPLNAYSDPANMRSIRLIGQSVPNMFSNPLASSPHPTFGSIIEGTFLGDSAVIDTHSNSEGWGNFNFMNITIENLAIRVRSMTGVSHVPAQGQGIQAYKMANIQIKNVAVSITSNIYLSVQPASTSAGIIMPAVNNFVMVNANNVFVTGFYYGIMMLEHSSVDNYFADACYYGIYMNYSNHSAHINKACVARSRITVGAGGQSRFRIDNLSIEDKTVGGFWWSNTLDLEANATAVGAINFQRVSTDLGGEDNSVFRRNNVPYNVTCLPLNENTPKWATANRPTIVPAAGTTMGYNTDSNYVEVYNHVNSTWSPVGSSGEVQAAPAAFPVGSVFISVVATNPNTLLGYGTWEAFAPGRMLVGFDNTNPNFDAAEETGGSASVTITASNLPQLSVDITDPGHTHVQNKNTATTGPLSGTTPDASTNTSAASGYSTASATTGITATANTGGANNSITVLNPYITVYMWKRTN